MGRGRRGRVPRGGGEAVRDIVLGEGQGCDPRERREGVLWMGPCSPALPSCPRGGLCFGTPRDAHRPIFLAAPFTLGSFRETGGWRGLRTPTHTFSLTMTLSAFRSVCGDESHDTETAQCLWFCSARLSTGGATPPLPDWVLVTASSINATK